MSQASLRITYPASLDNLPAISGKVLSFAEDNGVSAEQKGKLELALEETIVNIIYYAFEDNAQDHELEICAEIIKDDMFSVTISDDGAPFDPLTTPAPDLDVDIADRAIGGLGVMLVKELMDDVIYSRENDKNTLKLQLSVK